MLRPVLNLDARIGELLLLRGLITEAQLEKALALQLVQGARIGTNLVELEALSLDALASALGAQHGAAVATDAMLREVREEARVIVPGSICVRYGVIPLRLEAGTQLHLAMLDPHRLDVVDELAGVLGMSVIHPYVVPELRLHHYLYVHYRISRPARFLRSPGRVIDGERRQHLRPTPNLGSGREASLPPGSVTGTVTTLDESEVQLVFRGTPDEQPRPAPVIASQQRERRDATPIPPAPPRRDPTPIASQQRERRDATPIPPAPPRRDPTPIASQQRERRDATPIPPAPPRRDPTPIASQQRERRDATPIPPAPPRRDPTPRPPAAPTVRAIALDQGPLGRPITDPTVRDGPAIAACLASEPTVNATAPGTTPPAPVDEPAALAEVLDRLEGALDREELVSALLSPVAEGTSLVVLFLLRDQMAIALGAWGTPLPPRRVRELAAPAALSETLQSAVAERTILHADARGDELQRNVAGYLQVAPPAEVCLAPICYEDRVVNVLCWQTTGSFGPRELQALARVARCAAEMVARLRLEESLTFRRPAGEGGVPGQASQPAAGGEAASEAPSDAPTLPASGELVPLQSSELIALGSGELSALSSEELAAIDTRKVAPHRGASAGREPGDLPPGRALFGPRADDVTSTQISAIITPKVDALTSAQIAAMVTPEVDRITSQQLAALTTAQVEALQSGQIPALTDEQLQMLESGQYLAVESGQLIAALEQGPPRDDLGARLARQLTLLPRSQRQFGRFTLICRLASGGMANLYLARLAGQGGFEKLIAIKRIHDHLCEDRDFIQMFIDEARLAARISHPNVVQVIELDRVEGAHYIAMEYLDGESLSALLARAHPAPVLAARVVASAAAGLHAAHELRDPQGVLLGVVHRDVSPQNVLIGYQGAVKVVDFGVARARGNLHVTDTGTLKGKAAYMSPEQIRASDSVDRRSDVFALGIVLYEASTRRRLFKCEGEVETLQRVLDGEIPPPSRLLPGYPGELERIVLRALERDPARRYPTAEAMQADLERFIGRTGEPLLPSALGALMQATFADRIATKRFVLQQFEQQRATEQSSRAARLAGRAPAAPPPRPPKRPSR